MTQKKTKNRQNCENRRCPLVTGAKAEVNPSISESEPMADGYLHERLVNVKGDSDKLNNVFVCGNAKTCTEHIIFFGGDVQDYPEIMESHRDNKKYVAWNLEATSLKILHKFPNSLVMTVKPSSMYLMTYADYSNFVPMVNTCIPMHSENCGALGHLHELYKNILKEISNKLGLPNNTSYPLRIIGFSKGCVVLNQFVFELHLMDRFDALKKFVNQFKSIHWLDGGHNGNENTYVTQDEELKRLAALPCEIFINVSPYQIKNSIRTWVGKQEAKFYKKLKQFGAKVSHVIHFESEAGCIENHFRVLDEF